MLLKFILRLKLIILLIFGVHYTANATHVMGADISYTCLPNGDYVFTVVIYRDCAGTTLSSTTTLDFNSPSCGQNFSATLQQIGVQNEVSQVCTPQVPNTTCGSGSLPGTEQYIFSDTISLPALCTDWTYSWDLCCRNDNITNLVNPTSQDVYVEGTLNNTIGCNSSPQFSSLPTPYICSNQPYCYNHGTFDPDGDSLSFQLTQPLDDAGTPIPWSNGYSTNNPILNSSGFNFDPTTGEMCFTPNSTQTSIVSVLVEEWRNGVLVGSSVRELQFVIYNCTNQQPSDNGSGITNISGGSSVAQNGAYGITICPGDNFCIDMAYSDPDGDNVTLNDNAAQSIPGGTFSAPNNGTSANVAASFCWTPTALDTGLHILTVGVQDDGCPILGGNYYTYSIYVWDQTYAGPDQSYCPSGIAPQISVVGGNTFTWQAISGDPIVVGTNFSCNPCSNPIATPTQTTTYVVTSDLNATCGNTDTVTIFVVPDFPLVMSPDPTICQNEITQLLADATDPTHGPYTYNWNPSSTLDDPSIANPNANPMVSTTYGITVSSAAGCVMQDQVNVTVSGIGPTIYLNDTTICPLDAFQLNPAVAIEPGFCGPSTPGCSGNIVTGKVGNGSASSSTYSPFYGGTIYTDSRHQYLFTAAELSAAGVPAGKITELSFNILTKNSTTPYQNFQVSMGCTNVSCLTTNGGWIATTPVYGPVNYASVLGTNTLTLTTPFEWDGSSNLVIETCYDNANNINVGGYDNVEYTSGLSCDMYMRNYVSTNNSSGCALSPAYDYSSRANWSFTVCQTPPVNPTFSWTPTTGLSDPTIRNPIVSLAASRTYVLNVTDGASGCTGSGSITVSIDSTNYVTASPDVNICSGSTQLDATFFGNQPSPSVPCGYGGACSQPSNVYTVGNGTLSSSTYAPIYSNGTYTDSKHQYIILASELQAAGIPSGTFSTIAWNFTTVNSTTPYQNFSIGMGCTNETCLSDNNGWLPTSNVYGQANFSPVTGWNTITLNTTFQWDGVSNVVIETCFDNPNNINTGGSDNVQSSSGFSCDRTMRNYTNTSNTAGCSLIPNYDYSALPNFQFTVCPPDPTTLTYSWSPATGLDDANIQNPVATPTNVTNYVVTVTGGYCTAYDTVRVNIGGLGTPVIDSTNVSCPGAADGSITITATAGVAPYEYSIDSGATFVTTNVFTGLTAGNYNVAIADAQGCRAYLEVILNENDPIVIDASTIAATCGTSNGELIVNGITGGSGTYNPAVWTESVGGNTVATPSAVNAGSYTVTVTDDVGCTGDTTVLVNTNIGVITTTQTDVSCHATCDGSASISITGGNSPFNYNWTPAPAVGQGTNTGTGLCAGTYTVEITDNIGCTDVISIAIVEPAPIALSMTGTDASCFGDCDGTVDATITGGTGPYTYAWSDGSTTEDRTGLCIGTYILNVTDANSCPASGTIQINQPDTLIVTSSSINATCSDCNGGSSLSVIGGTVPYTYNWTTGGNASTAATNTGLCPGLQSAVVTDSNGCMVTHNLTIGDELGPTINGFNTINPTCAGLNNGSAEVLPAGGTGTYTYQWGTATGSQVSATANGLLGGTYSVTVSDANNCTATQTVTLTEPAQVVGIPSTDVTICYGDSAQVSASAQGGFAPYTINWVGGTAGTGPFMQNPLTTTDYCFTAVDSNGCASTQECVTLTVSPPLSVQPMHTVAICDSDAVDVSASASGGNGGPYTFVWISDQGDTITPNTVGNTSTINTTPTQDTWYYVTLSDGCSMEVKDSVQITINPLPVSSITVSDTNGCEPFDAVFNITTDVGVSFTADFDCDGTIDYSGTSTTPSYTYSSNGTYNACVTVTSADGCVSSFTENQIVQVYPLPRAGFYASPWTTSVVDPIILFNDSSVNATSYQWLFGDGDSITGLASDVITSNLTNGPMTNPTHYYEAPGTYNVRQIITTNFGCLDSISHTVIIEDELAFFCPNSFTPNGDGINDFFGPQGSGIDPVKYSMQIYNRWGQLIYETSSLSEPWDGSVNGLTKKVQTEVYVWVIRTEDPSGTPQEFRGHVMLIK